MGVVGEGTLSGGVGLPNVCHKFRGVFLCRFLGVIRKPQLVHGNGMEHNVILPC